MLPCAEQLPILIKKSFTFSDMMKWSLNRPSAQKGSITASNFPAETFGKALTSDYATRDSRLSQKDCHMEIFVAALD